MVNYLIGFALLVFILTFVSLILSGSKGWAWRVWGLIFSTLYFLNTLGRSALPHWGRPVEKDVENWDNDTPGLGFGSYDGTYANYALREELEQKRQLLAEGKEPGPIHTGLPKIDYKKSFVDVVRENEEALAEIEEDTPNWQVDG